MQGFKPIFANMSATSLSIEQILANLKIAALNEMQLASLEASKSNAGMVLLSDTGSGKTLAFLLPLLGELDMVAEGTQAIIIVPSRELALQIEQVFKSMGTGLKITACYGGHLRETEENNLVEPPAIIVGTPGRIADHLRRGNITADSIRMMVLDEFDKSLELGFEAEISFIIASFRNITRRILTSATQGVDIPSYVGLDKPARLEYLSGETSASLAIQVVKSDEKDKSNTLLRLLCMLGNRSAIVFCNHRESVKRVSNILKEKGIVNVFYHGALEQPERDAALCKFRNGSSDVLVTTDLASRGLDIPNIRYIIHYHLPVSEEAFIHRNGRTARMDASGTAILILGPDEILPDYLQGEPELITLPAEQVLPDKPKWSTLFLAAGKKDKVNKVDIVGFLTNKAQLKKEEIGLIEVKDFFSFVAVRKSKVGQILELIKNEKIKNRKVKIDLAR